MLAAKKENGESAVIINRKIPIKIDKLTTAIIVNYDKEKNELAYFFRVDDFIIQSFINKVLIVLLKIQLSLELDLLEITLITNHT